MQLDALIQLRVSAQEKRLWVEAAERAGLRLSTWVRWELAQSLLQTSRDAQGEREPAPAEAKVVTLSKHEAYKHS